MLHAAPHALYISYTTQHINYVFQDMIKSLSDSSVLMPVPPV